jgi:hypothetical protein
MYSAQEIPVNPVLRSDFFKESKSKASARREACSEVGIDPGMGYG